MRVTLGRNNDVFDEIMMYLSHAFLKKKQLINIGCIDSTFCFHLSIYSNRKYIRRQMQISFKKQFSMSIISLGKSMGNVFKYVHPSL